jgi:CubicO group peptidase (beta-lactamase class C family)
MHKKIMLYSICIVSITVVNAQQRIAERVDSLFKTLTKQNEPGGAVLVAKNNTVIFSNGYGLADMQTKTPVTTTTVFNTGSISKTFVSNAILLLAAQKKLQLTDNLLQYFPSFKNKTIAQQVQIQHLLTHTSGLPDCREVAKNPEYYLTANDEQNFAPLLQTDTMVFAPGNRFQYSNPAFNGLALIIEKLTGKKWQTYVTQQIYEKAGMKNSTITDGAHPQKGVAHGYEKTDSGFKELDYGEEPTFCAAGNGGIWSSVEELYKYYKALQKPAFLNRNIISNSMQVKTFATWNTEVPAFMGYGWFITKTFDGQQRIGHTGSQGGFTANFQFVPDKNIFVTMLFNKPVPVNTVMQQIEVILKEEGLL